MTRATVSPDCLPHGDTNNNDLKAPPLLPALVRGSCRGVQLSPRAVASAAASRGLCFPFRDDISFFGTWVALEVGTIPCPTCAQARRVGRHIAPLSTPVFCVVRF